MGLLYLAHKMRKKSRLYIIKVASTLCAQIGCVPKTFVLLQLFEDQASIYRRLAKKGIAHPESALEKGNQSN